MYSAVGKNFPPGIIKSKVKLGCVFAVIVLAISYIVHDRVLAEPRTDEWSLPPPATSQPIVPVRGVNSEKWIKLKKINRQNVGMSITVSLDLSLQAGSLAWLCPHITCHCPQAINPETQHCPTVAPLGRPTQKTTTRLPWTEILSFQIIRMMKQVIIV